MDIEDVTDYDIDRDKEFRWFMAGCLAGAVICAIVVLARLG